MRVGDDATQILNREMKKTHDGKSITYLNYLNFLLRPSHSLLH